MFTNRSVQAIKHGALALLSCLFFTLLIAQKNTTIPIATSKNALVLQTDANNRLVISYFGKKLANVPEYSGILRQFNFKDDSQTYYNNAYTTSGTYSLVEPAIQLIHGDGNASLDLKYTSHNIQKLDDNTTLTSIVLRDSLYPTQVTLFIKTWFKENVVEQWSVIKNGESKPVRMQKYASANLFFTGQKFYLNHYHGAWGREMKPEEMELTHGIKSIDTKLGTRANMFTPPVFMISFDKPATEDDGKVLMANLAWSGNFKADFEIDPAGNLRLIAGINPYASEYTLAAGQSFQTPSLIYTYSENGKGEASRNLHHWATKYRLADGQGDRLTLLNNWEATYFDFDENKLAGLFKDGKKLGVDLFLLDDGWFGNKYPRNGDNAALGDWQENKTKLPHGIGWLVKEAQAAGIKFGIWVEPEMISPKSELYEKHPDWVIREPQRKEIYYRNQLVLDLSNPAVQDFVFGVLDTLFTKNPLLSFIKWDCNAVTYNAHSAYLDKTGKPQTHLYVDYVKGLYKVLERLRTKYPKVPMMLCSGGGGRVDYEALKYFTEYWPSDNTDPLERIFIQWEYSYFYPAIASCNHVTDWSKLPLKYRTDVAMMGKLGFDIVVNNLSATDLSFAQAAVANYNSVKGLILHGDQYRLVDPWKNHLASLLYVNDDKSHAVVFNYFTEQRFLFTATMLPVKLKGLDAGKKYTVKEINLYPGTKSTLNNDTETYSGDYLMNVGFNPDVTAVRRSVILEVKEVK
jgi:alpha-galactosidase